MAPGGPRWGALLRPGLAALALSFLGCAPRGPTALTPAQLQSRASRALAADFDEAFDAAWLTLELAGWTVTESDARAGTAGTNVVVLPSGVGRGWTLSVTQEGTTPVVTLLPRVFQGTREVTDQMHWSLEGPGGEVEQWEALFERIRGLVDSWRTIPELQLSSTRGEVDAAGLRLLVPNWRHFEFSVDRRSLAMQGTGAGFAPTLHYRVERRRPQPDVEGVVVEVLERAFHAPGKIVAPPQWEVETDAWGQSGEAEVRVGAELTPRPVRWRRWEARSPAWRVWVVAACPVDDLDCERDVRAVIESAVNTGAAVPGFKTR